MTDTRYDFLTPPIGTVWVVTASLETSIGTPILSWRAALLLADGVFPSAPFWYTGAFLGPWDPFWYTQVVSRCSLLEWCSHRSALANYTKSFQAENSVASGHPLTLVGSGLGCKS